MGVYSLQAERQLEPDGALVAIVTLQQPFSDGVVRFRINAVPEIIFDERTTKVQIHGSKLVTGP